MPEVLEGIRVLDLSTGPVGGCTTTVLADFGADVIKLEPPGGDRFRTLAAAPLWLRGKRSCVLDLASDAGRAELAVLVPTADVLLVSGPPDRAERLGVAADALRERHPALVHCSITPFGPTGPWADLPGYEGVVAARAGRMAAFTGQRPREGPSFAAVPVASHATAQGAVHGILAALLARERSGRGARVETSLLQGLLPYDLVELLLVQLAARGDIVRQPVQMSDAMPTLNYHPVMASDGTWIQLGNLLEHLFFAFLDAIDLLQELIVEERFQGAPATWDAETVEAARDRILLRVAERPADEWMERFRANGNVAAEPYATPQQALDHADLVANGDVGAHEHPRLGRVEQIGPIARLTRTPGRIGSPAPEIGAHTDEVLREPRRTPPTPQPQGAAAPPGRPLDGITVVEFATIIAAPLSTSMLADLGARVIKVEPLHGDPYRHLLPRGVMAVKTNAGKQSLCLDLKHPESRGIVDALCARADVVVHNYRPGVPERLGIDYARLSALRPDLVWVSANGYGPDAPSARRPSAHPVPGAAMGGAGYQAGGAMPPREPCGSVAEMREAARQLMRANEPNPDPNTSVVIASATLLGLLARARHGVGQAIYVNMFAANAWANSDDFLRYPGKPPRPEVDAEVLGLAATYRLYPARSGWVFAAATTEREWRALCTVVGRDDLATDPRFATAAARRSHDAALAMALGEALRARDADDWDKRAHGSGCALVRADAATPGAFVASDAHVAQNGFAPSTRHTRFGDVRRWGPLVTCDGGPAQWSAAPLAGEHSDLLLREIGHGEAEIARLRRDGIVTSEPVGR